MKTKLVNIFSENFLRTKLHKVYLFLAIIIGVFLSVAMPVFSEPDAQMHFEVSSEIVGLANDLSVYNEPLTTGMAGVSDASQKEVYFSKYFETTVRLVPINEIPRSELKQYPSLANYGFWSHLIPAIGVWIGYHIYPSLGVMVVTARLFTMLILSFVMYLIIKKLKHGKLLFFAISLSPVILNTFASLSYDATSYVLAALAISLAINISSRGKVSSKDLIRMAIISVALYFAAKTNLVLLIFLYPLLIINHVYERSRSRAAKRSSRVFARKTVMSYFSRHKLVVFGILGTVFLILVFVIGQKSGGVVSVISRFFNTATYNMIPTPSTSSLYSLLAEIYPDYNNLPNLEVWSWYAIIMIIILNEEAYHHSRILSIGTLVLFLIGIIAVYESFIPYYPGLSRAYIMGAIYGAQGRYLTPTLLLLCLLAGYHRKKLNFKAIRSNRFLTLSVIALVVVSSVLLYRDTWFYLKYIL